MSTIHEVLDAAKAYADVVKERARLMREERTLNERVDFNAEYGDGVPGGSRIIREKRERQFKLAIEDIRDQLAEATSREMKAIDHLLHVSLALHGLDPQLAHGEE